ncbi:MAG: hybrid sensor histidine kinase/response regulator [Verrucomicrobiota bacterium]
MQRILIIEDAEDVRSLITSTLENNGFQTLAAEDGVAGVALAKEHLPDLILCDIQMPRLDGYGTLAALRQQAATAAIPFIFLTGITDKMHMRKGMEQGADDFLTKPFSLRELLGAVKAQLQKQAVISHQSNQRLEQLRDNLSLALPHELITPLNAIIGFSSLLMDDCASMPHQEIRDFAQNIHKSALRLQRLVENFLLYSQIELVAVDPDKVAALRREERSPIKERITLVARQKAEQAQRADDLALHLEDVSLPMASGKLEKIVLELLDNAFKFSDQGTPVLLAATVQDELFTLSVTDHGRGMTAEQIASIGAHMQFQRRLHEQQGSGLGLAIAKRLTELHGGELIIECTPNEKTTVRLLFPLSSNTAASADP